MNYTTVQKVRDYIGYTVSFSDSVITRFIAAMSRHMDKECDRKLVAAAVGSGEDYEEKYYDGNDSGQLLIDDAQNITKVEMGDQYGENLVEIQSTDYMKYPKVAPYKRLLLKSGSFHKGIQNIVVTGEFGLFADIPEDVEFACTVLAAGVVLGQDSANAITSEHIGNYSVSYVKDTQVKDFATAKSIIDSYRKMSL